MTEFVVQGTIPHTLCPTLDLEQLFFFMFLVATAYTKIWLFKKKL